MLENARGEDGDRDTHSSLEVETTPKIRRRCSYNASLTEGQVERYVPARSTTVMEEEKNPMIVDCLLPTMMVLIANLVTSEANQIWQVFDNLGIWYYASEGLKEALYSGVGGLFSEPKPLYLSLSVSISSRY